MNASDQFVMLADKVRVKQHVAKILGDEWVIPTLYAGEAVPKRQDILPMIPVAIKANHGAGWNIFVRSAEDATEDKWAVIVGKAQQWLNTHYEPHTSGAFYQRIRPQLLVEPFISKLDLPIDFKLYVFHGKVHFIQVMASRSTKLQCGYFDRDWNLQPFTKINYDALPQPYPAPVSLHRMIKAAETLADNIEFVRVDFYEIDGEPIFGEMTFTPAGGFSKFQPPEYDMVLGKLW